MIWGYHYFRKHPYHCHDWKQCFQPIWDPMPFVGTYCSVCKTYRLWRLTGTCWNEHETGSLLHSCKIRYKSCQNEQLQVDSNHPSTVSKRRGKNELQISNRKYGAWHTYTCVTCTYTHMSLRLVLQLIILMDSILKRYGFLGCIRMEKWITTY